MTMRVIIQDKQQGTLDKIKNSWVWTRPNGATKTFEPHVGLHDVNGQIAEYCGVQFLAVRLTNIL